MKYKVNWLLDMGKKQHKENDEIELKESEAADLVACGVLTPIARAQTAATTGSGSKAEKAANKSLTETESAAPAATGQGGGSLQAIGIAGKADPESSDNENK